MRLGELPEDQRRALSALKLSGLTWSENAALRTVILNSRLLFEGEEAAPGVTLRRITPQGAVVETAGSRLVLIEP